MALVPKAAAGGMGALLRPDARARAGGVFRAFCVDAEGNLKWEAEAHNLVTNIGLKSMNETYFTGTAYSAAWYIGLYGAAASNTPAATDTMSSHPGWTELTAYTSLNRPSCAFGTATTADPSVISNSASPAVFTMNATTTVGGAFLTSYWLRGSAFGILFCAADFDAPGDRNVVSGDTLRVTYTFNLEAA